MESIPKTLGEARERYLTRATLKSRHTVAAYRQSVKLFLTFLDETRGSGVLPLQQQETPAAEIPLNALAPGDAPILLAFAEWLLREGHYKASTVRLRLAGVGRWLQYLDDYGWLPADFPLAKALRMVRDELKTHRKGSGSAPEPPRGVEELLTYYESSPSHRDGKISTFPTPVTAGGNWSGCATTPWSGPWPKAAAA